MDNIYNAIQNLYNMDKTTWQEVLAELYNLVSKIDNKFDLFELKFGSLLGEQVIKELKKMYDDGSLASLINDVLLQDINEKVDTFKTEVSDQLDTKANKADLEVEKSRIDLLVKVENGETDGNTELLDIRIGVNGVTYDTAGNSVRIQLKDYMFDKLNNNIYYWERGAYDGDGNKTEIYNNTHTRIKAFFNKEIIGVTNNTNKTFEILIYNENGSYQGYKNLTEGQTFMFEENNNYTSHVNIDFENFKKIVDDFVFICKPNKILNLIEEKNKEVNTSINLLKKELGYKIEITNGDYNNVSIINDGSEHTYKGWFTSSFKECNEYKYLICEDIAFYSSVSINAISFFDKERNYIGGINSSSITGENIDSRYLKFNGTVKIPNNAYYFKDSKFNLNGLESKNIIFASSKENDIFEEINNLDNKIKNQTILCIGDSLTEGDYGSDPAGTKNVKAENYPFFLSKFLGCTVINKGKCGITATGYWNELSKTIDYSEVTTIIIMLGTNAVLTDTLETDTNITDTQTYEDYADTQTGNYCKIIEYALEQTQGKAQIVLCTPPHVGTKRQSNRNNAYNSNEVVKKIGMKYHVPVFDVLYEGGFSDYNQDVMQPVDNLHFGLLGYKKLATFIGSKLKSVLSFEINE